MLPSLRIADISHDGLCHANNLRLHSSKHNLSVLILRNLWLRDSDPPAAREDGDLGLPELDLGIGIGLIIDGLGLNLLPLLLLSQGLAPTLPLSPFTPSQSPPRC